MAALAGREEWKTRRRRRREGGRSRSISSWTPPSLVVLLALVAALMLMRATTARAAFSSAASIGGVRSVVEAIVEHEGDDQPAQAAAEEVLIGWKGETWQPAATAHKGHEEDDGATARRPDTQGAIDSLTATKPPAAAISTIEGATTTSTTNSTENQQPWIELLSWRPRAFLHHDFLSHAECDHIIHLAEGRVARSGVVDAKTGKTKLDPIRTSTGAALSRGQDATIAEIERRAAEWTRLPPDHAEAMQVLRYENGQTYKAHWDWFDDPVHAEQAKTVGNRIATVLFYLSDVDEGGATTLPLAFPANATRATLAFPPDKKADKQCAGEEAGMGLAIRPKKGDALLFWDMLADGRTVDRRSLHASCPTTRGTKWTATLWIRNKPYGSGYDPVARAGRCEDFDTRCEEWAAETPVSRCDSEARRLVGLRGVCRRACRDCVVCANDDMLCLRANGRSRRAELLAWDKEQEEKEKEKERQKGGGG